MLSKSWLIYIVSAITYMFTVSYFNPPPVYSKTLEKLNSRPTAYFSIKAHSKSDILQAPIQRHIPLVPNNITPQTAMNKQWRLWNILCPTEEMTWKFERRTYFLYHHFLRVHHIEYIDMHGRQMRPANKKWFPKPNPIPNKAIMLRNTPTRTAAFKKKERKEEFPTTMFLTVRLDSLVHVPSGCLFSWPEPWSY